MNDTADLLQIKIEMAKRELPLETINAINAVDWRAAILGLRTKKGYNFEQLGDLELETELLLCGLLSPKDYPRELENRMGISRANANELMNEMNNLVFKKIREELIKNTERKKIFASKKAAEAEENRTNTNVLNQAGIEIEKEIPPEVASENIPVNINREDILKKIENPELIPIPVPIKAKTEVKKEANPLMAQKLSSSFQVGVIKTEHSLENITKTNNLVVGLPSDGRPSDSSTTKNKIPNIDLYRELPE